MSMYARSVRMYASVVSVGRKRAASSRLAASSTNAIREHFPSRPSNQSRGDPSIRTSSPTRARRSRV